MPGFMMGGGVCPLCGRGGCVPSFHAIDEQEAEQRERYEAEERAQYEQQMREEYEAEQAAQRQSTDTSSNTSERSNG